MIDKKYTTTFIIILMAAAAVFCFAAILFQNKLDEKMGGTTVSMEYESKLFNTDEVMTIDIQIDEKDWDEMLRNATSEEYYSCDTVINGEKIYNVAIRPKGNTSLTAIAMDPESDRFSFKLEFDHFVGGQTCYGLDKLILNNNFADATNMKEAIIYDMYQYMDSDASLYNYAKVSVNGEYWGVYLALEGVEESFMLRNYGTQDGELYKPDSMEMGEMGNMQGPEMGGMQGQQMPNQGGGMPTPPGSEGAPQMGGFSMNGNGENLNYIDDDLDSYEGIWDGEITGTGKKDHKKVVNALKNISEGNDLEDYLDIDNVLKYMAVHTFAVNMDSLTGSMAHNYYLYEYDGKLNLFPWDYNLSFGGMSTGEDSDATSVVNFAIDTPFAGTHFFDALLEDEEYSARYHEYLQQLVDGYVNGGRFDETYNRIRSQIDSLVEEDPTAFYTYDEYVEAADSLYELIDLRAKSIAGQIDGSIPSTKAGQEENPSALIDASHIDLLTYGTFDMGGNMGEDMPEGFPEGVDFSEGFPGGDFEGGFPGGSTPEGGPGGGMPNDPRSSSGFGQSGIQMQQMIMKKDMILCLIYLAMMLAALLIVSRVKRRK